MENLAFVTVATNSHLAGAGVLAESLARQHPGVPLYVCLVDQNCSWQPSSTNIRTLAIQDILGSQWKRFAFKYPPFPLAAALKPRVLSHVFASTELEGIIYLDSDTLALAPLNGLAEMVLQSDIVITPHRIFAPTTSEDAAPHLELRKRGVYNSGVVGVRNNENGKSFLQWWATMTEDACHLDLAAGIFVDQAWLDLVPSCFDGVRVSRDPCLNVGHWNIDERALSLSSDGGVQVAGSRLQLMHFSGFDPATPEVFSTHDCGNRRALTSETISILRCLTIDYASQLNQHGFHKYSNLPSSYRTLTDGTEIKSQWRAIFLHCHPDVEDIDDPFDTSAHQELVKVYKRSEKLSPAQSLAKRFDRFVMSLAEAPVLGRFIERIPRARVIAREARRWN